MEIEIDVPDEIEFDGKVYIPTGEVREPKKGEVFLGMMEMLPYKASEHYGISKNFILKPKRWRAQKGGSYFSIDWDQKINKETGHSGRIDDKAYNSGNYFQTEQQAQKVVDQFKLILKAEHDEV